MSSKEIRYTDPGLLASGAYKDSALIEKRAALYKFTTPYYDINQEVTDNLDLKSNYKVLDVGCGKGKFVQNAASVYPDSFFVALDISAGMFKDAERQSKISNQSIEFVVGDIQNLGFNNQTFQRVVVMHMLYHVPDIPKGVGEMARVLTDDGLCLVTANSLNSKPTKRELKKAVAEILGRKDYPEPSERFNIETGESMLRSFFEKIRLIKYESVLRLTDSGPYVQYFDSLREFWNPLPTDNEWEKTLSLVKKHIAGKIDTNGFFEEANIFGLFLCSKKT